MSHVRTFRHRFQGGITCEVIIDLDKLLNRQPDYLSCEWSRRPKPRTIPGIPTLDFERLATRRRRNPTRAHGAAASREIPLGSLGLRARQSA
jgi:hypothetical protein